MKMKKDLKNEKAITLVALIVTIIVLLILAGVTIATLTGENGILTKGSVAKLSTEQAQILEQLRLELYEKRLDFENNLTEINYLKEKGIISNEITGVGELGKYASINEHLSLAATYIESSNIYYIINIHKLVATSTTGNGNWENGDVYYILDGNLYYKSKENDSEMIGTIFEEKTTGKIKWLYQENEGNIEIIGMDLSELKYELGNYSATIFLEVDSLTVPSQINGKSVTKISFKQSILPFTPDDQWSTSISIHDVKRLTYSDTIETIDNTFYFPDVEEIHLPNHLKAINSYMFSGYSRLKEINIPDSITTIGDRAFYSCKNLEELILSNNITSIGDSAFEETESLTLNFANGKNDALVIPEDKWGANKILINGTEYTP